MTRARTSTDPATGTHTLRNYALLADGHRGCLLAPDGNVSWWCFPTWSEPAICAALLGSGGSYVVAPRERHVYGGYYEDGSLIWRQRWVTVDGLVETREAMAYPGLNDSATLLRRVTAVDGTVPMAMRLELSPDYGRAAPSPWRHAGGSWLSRMAGGLHARWHATGPAPIRPHSRGGSLELSFTLSPGETIDFALEVGLRDFDGQPTLECERVWRVTERAWADAVPRCDELPAGRDVRHAFAVLRGLTTDTGATVAAASTALPERAEAGRNYDYRYAWIRDTCYIGHAGAAAAGGEHVLDDAVRWVSERLLADGPDTKPAYCVDGQPVPQPTHLGMPGYPGGSDVIGNRVSSQFQLDLFGESLLLLANAASRDRLNSEGWQAAEIAIRAIESRHQEPEAGIWEIHPNRWTHSRLISVAGLRAIAEHGGLQPWSTTALSLADSLLSEVDRTSLHPSGRWQRAPDDDRVDAALLLAEVRGAVPAGDPRSIATRRAIRQELCEDDFLYRYSEPGKPLGDNEGAFLICNFWMALACLKAGDITDGVQWFERTRASCGTNGLFSEEYDVAQRQLRGNIPQAFVHALLIETAAELTHV